MKGFFLEERTVEMNGIDEIGWFGLMLVLFAQAR